MRSTSFSINGVSASISYPESTIFAFNPNYINFSNVTGATFARISCGSYEFDVAFYNGSAQADISLLLQTQFTNPRTTRSKSISITIEFDGVSTNDTTLSMVAIWGSSSVGERLNSIGAYHYDKVSSQFVRNVRWFFNYPQKLSVYKNGSFLDFTPTKNTYTYDLSDTSVEQTAVFDHTFDDTFVKNFSIDEYTNAKINLIPDHSKDGYFLRWLDNFGMYQYFLFSYNERTLKFAQNYEVQESITLGGYDFGGGKRMLEHTLESKRTCSAMHLTREEALYVQTIVNSPFVDMYQGTVQGGSELWVPVTLVEAEKKVDEKKELNDFEITFIVPTSRPQQL